MFDETDIPSVGSVCGQNSSSSYSPSDQELDPEWRMQTLVQAVGWDTAQAFFWKAETDTVQTYEHRLTYRYVHIDSITGTFCNQSRATISAETALRYALPHSDGHVWMTVLAPTVLEPNLLRFVRHTSVHDVDQRPLRTGRYFLPLLWQASDAFANLYRYARLKFLLQFHTRARVNASQGDEQTKKTLDFRASDLTLSTFMRKTA